jgi:hypothetical protein
LLSISIINIISPPAIKRGEKLIFQVCAMEKSSSLQNPDYFIISWMQFLAVWEKKIFVGMNSDQDKKAIVYFSAKRQYSESGSLEQ